VSSFKRGLRNKSPLVLVVALALLVPALLCVEEYFTSGAWSAVPVQYWVRSSNDDYMYVSWTVAALKRHPPELPLVTLLGGSSGREAISSGSLAREVRADGGPRIVAYDLSSRMQRYAQSWAIVDNLPDTPTTVLVGVNLGRFTTSPKSNYNQVIGRELLLKSDSLRRWVVARSGEHRYSYTILPGVFSALTAYAQQRENGLLLHSRLRPKPYRMHAFDGRKALSPAAKHKLVEKWLTKYYPPFKRVLKFNLVMLDQVIKRGKQRGLDMVIVELPNNRDIIGNSFDAAMTAYRVPTKAIADKYGVPYLDFNARAAIPTEDFLDLSHVLPAGRVIWERELAAELARMYDDGTLRETLP